MRILPACLAVLSIAGMVACSDSEPAASSTPDKDASNETGTEEGNEEEGAVAFDACALISESDAAGIIGYPLTPCRKEPVTDAVRHVFESPADAPLEAIGSVNITVEAKGKSFDEVAILCGATGASCVDLPGLGDKARLNLKYTTVYVKKDDAVFAAQCERPGQISATEDATIQERLGAESKSADLSVRSDESSWRNSASCSLAVAKLLTAKLP